MMERYYVAEKEISGGRDDIPPGTILILMESNEFQVEFDVGDITRSKQGKIIMPRVWAEKDVTPIG